MREIHLSGSEGGGTELNRFSLPLSEHDFSHRLPMPCASGRQLRQNLLADATGVASPGRRHKDCVVARHGTHNFRPPKS